MKHPDVLQVPPIHVIRRSLPAGAGPCLAAASIVRRRRVRARCSRCEAMHVHAYASMCMAWAEDGRRPVRVGGHAVSVCFHPEAFRSAVAGVLMKLSSGEAGCRIRFPGGARLMSRFLGVVSACDQPGGPPAVGWSIGVWR